MTVFTYSKARQNFAKLLDIAHREGEVLIKRKDGTVFRLKPEKPVSSPLNVKSVKSKITTKEIVEFVRELRSK